MIADDQSAASGQLEVPGALASLLPLVGTWRVEGPGTSGIVRYSWAPFGPWLVQDIDLVTAEGTTRGVEYIGHDPETDTLRSHYFGSAAEPLEYTYQLQAVTLTIYFGGPDSPAKFTGTFDDDFTVNTGAWSWPGGGYDSTMTRTSSD